MYIFCTYKHFIHTNTYFIHTNTCHYIVSVFGMFFGSVVYMHTYYVVANFSMYWYVVVRTGTYWYKSYLVCI